MRLFGFNLPFSKRSNAPSVADDRWFSPILQWYGWNKDGDIQVTPETAVRFSAVFGCVKIISETIGSVPLLTYKRIKTGGKDRAFNHPVYKLLKNRPNPWQTGMEFREMLTGHVALRGNGYAQILRNAMGDPVELRVLHPSRTRPEINQDGQLVYRVTTATGDRILQKSDVFHLKGYCDSGYEGISPIGLMAQAVALGLATENFGTNFFGNSAAPAGVLKFDAANGTLSKEAKDRLKSEWDSLYGGAHRGKKTAVLEAGLSWQQVGIPAQDAQFLETRKFQIQEIARIYRIPPHMLADLDRASFANIEQQSIDFITYTMLPWFRRWEETIVRDLLDGDDSRYFSEFLVEGFMRGDTASRYSAYATARQWGWLSPNEIRERENMNPIGPAGDSYLTPLNMVPLGQEPPSEPAASAEPASQGKREAQPTIEAKKPPEIDEIEAKTPVIEAKNAILEQRTPVSQGEIDLEKCRSLFREPLLETWKRVVRKEIGTVKTQARKQTEPGELDAWLEEFLSEHVGFANSCLSALLRTYAGLTDLDLNGLCAPLIWEYPQSVREAVKRFEENPAAGYDRQEDAVALYFAERLLSYDGTNYGQAA